ncbi:MAG TPA: hypothetical protein VN757_03750 [Steroidobacteraceae bacterium]|nr:hypothetical protein [Steroidobacteraceae bacterium]
MPLSARSRARAIRSFNAFPDFERDYEFVALRHPLAAIRIDAYCYLPRLGEDYLENL